MPQTSTCTCNPISSREVCANCGGAGKPWLALADAVLAEAAERLGVGDAKGQPPAFKPSDVDLLGSFPPLCATMGRTEQELAAVLLVRACQARGDEWRAQTLRTIGEVIGEDLDAKREPLHSMNANPFCRPDMHGCVADGFTSWLGEPGTPGYAVEFTEKGLSALRRWVRSDPPRETRSKDHAA